MKLNPCNNCGNEGVHCTYQDEIIGVMCFGCFNTVVENATTYDQAAYYWNSRNPNATAIKIDTSTPLQQVEVLQQAMLQSLMKRYAVNGKISDVGMPIYDRECLKLLFEQGVLSLSNGLYQPK